MNCLGCVILITLGHVVHEQSRPKLLYLYIIKVTEYDVIRSEYIATTRIHRYVYGIPFIYAVQGT